jgi:hypothetical protein
MFGESSPPLSDRPGAHLQPPADLGVALTVGCEQHQLRSLNVTMRPRVARRTMRKLSTLELGENDLLSAWTRHRQPNSRSEL